MKRYRNSYAAIAIICGLIGVIGFFFFPVMQYRSDLAHELAGTMLDYSGNGDLRNLTMGSFIGTLFQDGKLEEIDYVVKVLGYHSAASVFILYCLPLVGSIGFVVAGMMGKQAKKIMIALGIVNGICYIIQIVTFPGYTARQRIDIRSTYIQEM